MASPTTADEVPDVRVAIVDFGTGRFVGGHNEDYLTALEQAVEVLRPVVVAPFRRGRALGRFARYRLESQTYFAWLGWRGMDQGVVVCHSPEFHDLALFWLVARLTPRRRGVGLFVLRRSAEGIVGRNNRRARFLTRVVPGLIRSGRLYPASDSRPALAHWTHDTGVPGSLIAIPPPLGAPAPHPRPTGGPVVGLVGRLRIEKGARAYDLVVREALQIDETAAVKVQVGAGMTGEAAGIANRLERDWRGVSRVEIIPGHLTPEGYANLIGSTDVIVLPYEPSSYSNGTSGVLHDAISLGRVVLASPIAWAAELFPGHDNIIWLEGTDGPALRKGLTAAVARAMVLRDTDIAQPLSSSFSADWLSAIRAAAATMREPQ